MDASQQLILLILACTIALFLWGRWRHDIVALAALLACVVTGLTPAADAFVGFGHPAVITVAAVLILSKGLQTTGAVEALAQRALPQRGGVLLGLGFLTLLGAALSAFMNNVGAMALLMPIAMQLANRQGVPPGRVLMPLAFGTILGGMTTLIGTPPNLIVSGFRAQTELGAYSMFDFTPVGLAVALGGVLLAVLASRWLVPHRPQPEAGSFDTGTYLTEVHIDADSKIDGKPLREVEQLLDDGDAQIVGMVRNDFRVIAPLSSRILRAGDILVIESDPEALGASLTRLGLKLEEAVPPGNAEKDKEKENEDSDEPAGETTPNSEKGAEEQTPPVRHSDEIVLQEMVVQPGADILGRSASDIALRTRFGINLLAISRQGHRSIRRLRWTEVEAGDVLLLQGDPEAIAGFASEYGCAPLAPRSILIPDRRLALTAVLIMLGSVGLAAFGILPAAVAFTAGVLGYMLTRVIPLRRLYEAIDWPIIVLLGALMPLAAAMGDTGAADVLARTLLEHVAQGSPIIALTLMLVVTMTLSDFMNNAATAAVMCPIALSVASQLGVNPDSFLMAVAIGASCAFLTPIGHQNNTLILGPGGFRFGDYWRLGLPMELLVVTISIPMLLWVWPL
ncbi:SLC13 family permease [Pseudomonas abyssi]|jgi:di/tricarboxylate transporter|uniref:SLC13 family permease n=1 Tax=Pseudomonas abyssi TaxID=170540 RepID=A0A2A3MKB1_9PSED|nr:SLC13 family permease [Pseudomonas abyssi]PBK05105.1 SLC13 family permease [Pseudomonas abyssi]|tara:strand:- start:14786 stop:16654 length:1869 start_codon:yes stop_codon:yes gene_type:complete